MNRDRYLKIVEWARRRYTRNGVLITYIGTTPSRYTEIEGMAWTKYIFSKRV